MMVLRIIILFSFISTIACEEGFLEKLKNGLQSMRNYLETVKEVADLVSDSLKKPEKKKGDENAQTQTGDRSSNFGGLASVFFRLLGLDTSKIAAITVNSAIFLAQVIASFFETKSPRDSEDSEDSEFDIFKSIIESPDDKIQNILSQAQSPELPKQITEQLDGMDLTCVKLLVCKMSPFILKAQKSLRGPKIGSKRSVFTSWLPTQEEFEENSENCEEEHKDCRIFPEEKV